MQADRGLPGAGRALHAHGRRRARPDDVVLLGLDRRDDVAHRAGSRPLDLVDQQVAGGLKVGFFRTDRGGCCLFIALEPFVFVGGERAAGETEPSPEGQAHRVGLAGPVERPRYRGPPVEHDRGAVGVVHVAAADVEVGAREVLVLAGQLAVVEAAEEQGGVGQVLQRLGPAVQVGLEVLERDAVARHRVLGELKGVLAHQVEELAGAGQVGALGGDDAVLDACVGLVWFWLVGRCCSCRLAWLRPLARRRRAWVNPLRCADGRGLGD